MLFGNHDPAVTGFEQFALAGVFGLFGLGGMAAGGSSLRSWQRTRSEDLDTVADATDGDRVQLEGTARPVGEPMASPVEGTPCLAYQAKLEFVEYGVDEEAGDTAGNVVLGRRHERESFLLEAGDGTVLVDPESEDATLEIDDQESTRKEKPVGEPTFGDGAGDRERGIPEAWQAAFDDLNVQRRLEEGGLLADDGEIRFTATLLVPDETCFVDGAGYRPDEVSQDVPEAADAVVRSAEGSEASNLSVSDQPREETASSHLQQGVFLLLLGALFLAGALFIVMG
jgi:hypothetical protein